MKPLFTSLGTLLLAVLPWTSAFAGDEEVTRLTLEHNDGTQSHYVLTEKPEITFENEHMVVTIGEVPNKVERASLSHFHFTTAPMSAVENISADDYMFSYLNNVVKVRGNGVTTLKVYDVNGRAVMEAKASDGVITADMSELQSGVYVISVAGKPAVKVRVNN